MSDVARPEDELSATAKALGATTVYPAEERRSDHGEMLDYAQPGISLRHWFAAMAMQGLCANSIPGSHHHHDFRAREAVEQADALLKELAK